MDKVETWLDFLMLCRSRSDLQKLQSKSRWRRVSHTLQPHAVAHAHAVLGSLIFGFGLSQPKLCWMELLLPGIANCFCMDLVLFDVWAFSEWQKMTDRSDRSKCQKWCVWIFFFLFFLFFLFFFNLFFRRRRSVWCLMLGRSSGLSCHVSPEKLSEAFKMSFRLCQVGMFFLDIAVVIGLRSQLSLISLTRCHRDISWLQLCNCFRCLGCSAILQLHSCRMQIFLESIGKKGTGQFLKLHLMTCTDFWKKQDVKTKWKSEVKLTSSFFPFRTICFFRIQVLPFFSIVWKQISWSLTSSTSASPRSGDYVKESHGQRIGQAGSFMWHMFFHPRIDWILADLSLATPRCHDAWRRPQVELPKDHPYLSLLADEKHEIYEKRLRKAKIQGLLTEYPFARYES